LIFRGENFEHNEGIGQKSSFGMGTNLQQNNSDTYRIR